MEMDQLMNNPTYVDKSEELYRRILSNKCNTKTPPQYIVEASGNIRITSPAFLGGDRPSVDRAKKITKPECTKRDPTDGVVCIKAADIKPIKIRNYIKPIKIRNYTADVEITPLDCNPAHAEIVLIPEPEKMTDSMKSNLRDALARKATCILRPIPNST